MAVLLNTSDEDQTVKLEGMPAGAYTLWRTDDTVSLASQGTVTLEEGLVIPAHSFTTLVGC